MVNKLALDWFSYLPSCNIRLASLWLYLDWLSFFLSHSLFQGSRPRDCSDIYASGQREDGIYSVFPTHYPTGFQVYCDMSTDGGGWTVSHITKHAYLLVWVCSIVHLLKSDSLVLGVSHQSKAFILNVNEIGGKERRGMWFRGLDTWIYTHGEEQPPQSKDVMSDR